MSRATPPRSPSKAAPGAASRSSAGKSQGPSKQEPLKSAPAKQAPSKQIAAKTSPSKAANAKETNAAPVKAVASRPTVSPVIKGAPNVEKADSVGTKAPAYPSQPTRLTPAASSTNILDGASPDPGYLSNDEVFDEVDQAQYLQLMEQAAIAERAKSMNQVETHPDFDGKHCVECDVVIPMVRINHGKVRCVDCQADLEDAARRKALMTAK